LTQHHTKANQVAQVADRGPGKKKGLVDSLPPGQELQADRGAALNPETIHSNLDDTVTREPAPGLELNLDRGVTLNFEMINSELSEIVTRELPPDRQLNPDRGVLNPDTVHSDLAAVMTGGLWPGLELNPDPEVAFNLDTIHSNLDEITPRGLPTGFELDLGHDKSLHASRQAKVAPGTTIPETDDAPATGLPRRWELRDGRAMLRSPSPELDDDDDNWKFVPYFGGLLLFFSWIVQSGPIFLKSRRRLLWNPLQK
jgi:hypothetical protein